jgi:hypothetical protein
MQTSVKSEYVKRTQKDYSLSFKLQIVEKIDPSSPEASGLEAPPFKPQLSFVEGFFIFSSNSS